MRLYSLSKFSFAFACVFTFQNAFAVQMVATLCASIDQNDPLTANQIYEFYGYNLEGASVGDFLFDAAHLGHTNFVQFLLSDKHVEALDSDDLDEAVLAAIAGQHEEVIDLLLRREGAAESALIFGASQGHEWAVRFLRTRLNNLVARETVIAALEAAAANGFTNVVDEIVNIGTIEPVDLGFARLTAEENGFTNLARYFDDLFRVRITYMNLPTNVAIMLGMLYARNFGPLNPGGGRSK